MKKLILLPFSLLIFNGISNAQTDVINIIPSGNVGISSTAPVSALEVGGSFGQKVSVVTANTTLDATHNTVVCNNGSTAIAITLPTASAATGRVYVIKRNAASTANVTVIPTPTLDGQSTYVLTMPNQSVEVFSDGSEWKASSGGLSANGSAWNLSGNSGTTASTSPIGTAANNNFIGTTDAKDFVMASSGLERMRVSSGGNIGIGTSAPNGKLTVVDGGANTHAVQIIHTNATNSNGLNIQTQTNIAADFALRVVPNAGATDAFIVRNTGNVGIGTTSPTAVLNISSASTSTPIHLNNTATGTTATDGGRIAVHDAGAFTFTNYENSAFIFNTSGVTERMRLTDAGNLGVGSSSPGRRLDVAGYGTGNYEARIGSGTVAQSATLDVIANHDAIGLQVWDDNNLTTPRFVVMRGGNVGIATTAPAYFLQVGQNTASNNTDYSAGILRHGTSVAPGTYTANIPAFLVQDYAGDGPASAETTGMVNITVPRIADADANAGNALLLSVSNDNGYALTVKGNRNVGIGTSMPAQRLEVSGNARVTGLASGVNGAIVRSNASGDLSALNFSGSATEVLTGAGTFVTVGSLSGDDWTLSGSNLYANNTGWNVGIGNTSPSFKLDVTGTARIGATGGVAIYSADANTVNFRPSVSNGDILITDDSGSLLRGLTVANGGNVGVGTDAPAQKLEVAGGARVTGLASGGSGAIVKTNSSGDMSVTNFSGSGTDVLTGAGTFVGISTISGDDWTQSGSNLYPNTLSWNVGVGTSSPTAKLHVTSDVSASGTKGITFQGSVAETNNNGRAVSVLRNSGTEVLGVNNEGIITGYTTAGTNTFLIDPRTNLHTWFNTGGNLGIGNNAPGFRLDVTGNARIGNTGGVVVASLTASRVNLRPSVSNGDIVISDDSGTPARGVTVANGGNLGVGTDVPAAKLHVVGTTYPQAIIDQAGSHAILDIRTTDASAFEQGIRFYRNGVHQAEIYSINGDQKLHFYLNGADRVLFDNAGNVNIPGLAASSAVYTDASKNLTTTAPTTGTLGYWTRSGTSLYNTTLGDNVGVGTSAPQNKLHVNGGMRWGGATVAPYVYSNEDASGLYLEQVGTSTANSRIRLQSSPSGSQASYAQFYIDPVNGFSFLTSAGGNSGYVGIGTASPGAALHIAGSNQALRLDYNNTTSYSGSLRWSGLQLGNNGDNRIVAGRTSTGGQLSFYVNNTNDAADYSVTPDGTMAMRILSGGNVGIGSGTPADKLDVAGHITLSGGAKEIRFRNAGGTAEQYIWHSGTSLGMGVGSAGNSMFINSVGNVGIGTTTPASFKVQSAGSIGPNADVTYDLGSPSLRWNNLYVNSISGPGALWTRSGSTLYNSTLADNVGIGTSSPVSKLNVSGGDLQVETGQGRFKGWYTGGSGLGAEIGISSGQAYVYSYNRTSNAYQPMNLSGSTVGIGHSGNTDMFISTAGNVGIGTTNPTQRLDVQGGYMKISDVVGGAATTQAFMEGSSGVSYFGSLSTQRASFGNSENWETLTADDSNVGIGSTAPGHKLDIQGPSGVRIGYNNYEANLVFGNNSSWKSGIRTYDNGVAEMRIWHVSTSGLIAISTGYNGDMSTTLPTDGLFVKSNNVGIGTASPLSKLHVTGQTTPGITVTSSNYSGSYKTQLGTQGGAQGILVLGNNGVNEIRFGHTNTGGMGYIYVNNTADYSASANGTVAMTFANNGNVGIGNTSASYKLEVSGNVVNSTPSQGYLALTGDLPGYAVNTYPTLKTNGSYIYFSAGGAYSSYISTGGTYTVASSKSKKENFEVLDKQDILQRINGLEMTKWNYKEEDSNIKHIGPFAQDFHEKFGLNGPNNTMLSYTDLGGVAIVGIQALYQNQAKQSNEVNELKAEIAELKKTVLELQQKNK